MATRLSHVVIDANDPGALARFWAAALDWPIVIDDPREVEIGPRSDGDVPLIFVPVPEPKVTKNRLHLDVSTTSDDHYDATIERLIGLGARHADIGQQDITWTVLADPEGNELCVLRPDPDFVHAAPIATICLDADDVPAMAEFWSAATGWPILRADTVAVLVPERGPPLTMGPKVAPKRGTNRLHIDLRPEAGGDTGAEADRLVALGATRVDIGQRHVPWIVLADPEGNEFCVLTPASR